MPTSDVIRTGVPCWIDLISSDVDRSVTFYRELLGWSADAPAEQFGGYINFRRDGSGVAGLMAAQPDMGAADVWSIYLATDDARKTVDVAVEHGATVIVPAMDVDSLGTMAVISDPTGAAVGLWQPGDHKGFSGVGETGAPGWFELSTRDHDRALDFYTAVFGLGRELVSDDDPMRYTALTHGDDQVAGIMDATAFLPEDVPPHWAVYLTVDDTDAALRRVTDLGGAVITPAMDTPYGRLATAADSTGAVFKLGGPTGATPTEG